MNGTNQYLVDAVNLKAVVKHTITGEVDYVTGSRGGWTVHLRDARDLPACTFKSWAGLPVKYAAPGAPRCDFTAAGRRQTPGVD